MTRHTDLTQIQFRDEILYFRTDRLIAKLPVRKIRGTGFPVPGQVRLAFHWRDWELMTEDSHCLVDSRTLPVPDTDPPQERIQAESIEEQPGFFTLQMDRNGPLATALLDGRCGSGRQI